MQQPPQPPSDSKQSDSSKDTQVQPKSRGSILARVLSVASLPKAEVKQHKKYKLLHADQQSLTKKIPELYPTAESLLRFIETQLGQGVLPEIHFNELLSHSHYAKELNKYEKRISAVYCMIIDIFANGMTSLNKNQVKSIKIAELISPKKATNLTKVCYAQSDNLMMYIIRTILGFKSKQACDSRDKTISDKHLLYQRTLRYQMWVTIAQRLKNNCNEMGCQIVLQAITGRHLSRLKKTRAGLSAKAQKVLVDLDRYYVDSCLPQVTANYYKASIRKGTFLPLPFYALRPLILVTEMAGDVQLVVGKEGVWDKIIKRHDLNDEEILNLLLEEQDHFATAIPIWAYLMTVVSRINPHCELEDLEEAAVISSLDFNNSEQISETLEAPGSGPAVASEYTVIPVGLLDAPLGAEASQSTLQIDEFEGFYIWFSQNYVEKLKTLNERLLQLKQTNDALLASSPDATPDYMQVVRGFDEPFIVTVSQFLHVAHVLRCFGKEFSYSDLGIDEAKLSATEVMIKELAVFIAEVKKMYYQIRQVNINQLEETFGVHSLKADFVDLENRWKDSQEQVEKFIHEGTVAELEAVKKQLLLLTSLHEKYRAQIKQAENLGDNFGKKAFLELCEKFKEKGRMLEVLTQAVGKQEESFFTDIAFTRITQSVLTRLGEQENLYKSCASILNLKQKKALLLQVLVKLETLQLEIPLVSLNNDRTKRIVEFNARITRLSLACNKTLEDIHMALQSRYLVKHKLSNYDELAKRREPLNREVVHSLQSETRLKLAPMQSKLLCNKLRFPQHLKLGKFTSDGNIFDAIAILMNSRQSERIYNESILRQECHSYYLTNRERLLEWRAPGETQTEVAKDSYFKVQYTKKEMLKFFKGEALRGGHQFEGRLLCAILRIAEMYVVQITNSSKNNALRLTYTKITSNGCEQVSKNDYKAALANNVPMLILNQEGQYLPVLPKTMQVSQLIPPSPESSMKP